RGCRAIHLVLVEPGSRRGVRRPGTAWSPDGSPWLAGDVARRITTAITDVTHLPKEAVWVVFEEVDRPIGRRPQPGRATAAGFTASRWAPLGDGRAYGVGSPARRTGIGWRSTEASIEPPRGRYDFPRADSLGGQRSGELLPRDEAPRADEQPLTSGNLLHVAFRHSHATAQSTVTTDENSAARRHSVGIQISLAIPHEPGE